MNLTINTYQKTVTYKHYTTEHTVVAQVVVDFLEREREVRALKAQSTTKKQSIHISRTLFFL